jgi:hypothetical protein
LLYKKALPAWLNGSALLDVVSAMDALARLRVVENSVIAVDLMLGF